MTSRDVVDLYRRVETLGIAVWIDGGWGVDALLGRQTRPHKDLDIAIEQKHVPRLRQLLEDEGYRVVQRDDTSAWNFVLGDDLGRQVDVHVIVLDDVGNGIFGPKDRGLMYPAAALTGRGVIDNQQVKCVSAEWAVKFHSGYELTEKDYRDVSALCEKFGIDLPADYARFERRK